jgi:multidrug transporter EmrE-like cation transporter
MAAFSTVNIVTFLVSVALQIVTMSLLPLSRGYTVLWPTLCVIAAINIAVWLFARIVASGAQLSILIPLSATLIPLCVIAVAIFVYGEPAPVLKILLLVAASVLIGIASGLR